MPRKLLGPIELTNSINHTRNPYHYQRLHQKIDEEWADLKLEGLYSTFNYDSESPSLQRFRRQQAEGTGSGLPYYRKGRIPPNNCQYMTKQEKLNYLKEVYQLTGLVAPKIGDHTRFHKSEEKKRRQNKFVSRTGQYYINRDLYEESKFAGPYAPWGSSYFDPFPEKAEHHDPVQNRIQEENNNNIGSLISPSEKSRLNKNQIEDQLRDNLEKQNNSYKDINGRKNKVNEYEIKKYKVTKERARQELLFSRGSRGPVPPEASVPQPSSGIGLNFDFDNRWSTVYQEQYRPATAPPDLSKSKLIRNRYGEMTKYADLPQKRAELSSFKLRNYERIKSK